MRSGGSCEVCGKQTERSRHSHCSIKCAWAARRAEAGGRRVLRGRPLLYRPDHPRATHGYVPEHVLIAEAALGRYLDRKHHVHHHNRKKSDNANTNLVICEDTAYHALLHVRTRIVEAGGDPDRDKICGNCGLRPRSEFGPNSIKPDGLNQYCRPCDRVLSRLRYGRRKQSEVAA